MGLGVHGASFTSGTCGIGSMLGVGAAVRINDRLEMCTALTVSTEGADGGVIATVTAAGAPALSQPDSANEAITIAGKMNMACGGNILIAHPPSLSSSGQHLVPMTVERHAARSISACTEQSLGRELEGCVPALRRLGADHGRLTHHELPNANWPRYAFSTPGERFGRFRVDDPGRAIGRAIFGGRR